MDPSTAQDSLSTTATTDTPTTPRLFWVGMAVFLTGIVVVGFWPTYFGPLVLGQEAPPDWGFVKAAWPIHLHAAVFTGWMALLVAQTVLVAREKTQAHMQLGQYVATFGLTVILVGLIVTVAQIQAFVSSGNGWISASTRAWNSLVPILVQFPLLLGLGYVYRMRPAAHKRYMLFATIALARAAEARIATFVWSGEWIVEILILAEAGPIWVYDLYVEGRIHLATVIGTAVVLLTYAIGMLMG
ncbi:MAG: hypothetical protein ABEK84_00075 [Salinibacter sp.]